MTKLLRDCFTGVDGQTWDIGRILWAKGVVVFLWLATYTVVCQKKPFDLTSFGVGLGAVLAAGGAALGMKARTEPGKP